MTDKVKARDLYDKLYAVFMSGVVTQEEMLPLLTEIKEYFNFDEALALFIRDIINKIRYSTGASNVELDSIRGLLHDEWGNVKHTKALREAIRLKYKGRPSKLEEFM